MTDTLRTQIVNAIVTMHGWCSPDKALAMADLILREHPRIVVELGVFGGRSSIPQAMALREVGAGTLYAIDPWKKSWALDGDVGDANAKWWSDLNLHDIHRSCIEEIWKHDLDNWACVIRCPSTQAVTLFEDNQIDILHIDGCHSETASCRDVSLYLSKVRHGGHVWFDDIDWQTTQRALQMLESQTQRVDTVGTCALFRKP